MDGLHEAASASVAVPKVFSVRHFDELAGFQAGQEVGLGQGVGAPFVAEGLGDECRREEFEEAEFAGSVEAVSG